jgi:hypothetical protein
VSPSTAASATCGETPIGLAGIWTRVWQVTVGARLSHFGPGHRVVLIADQTNGYVQAGAVIATWGAP